MSPSTSRTLRIGALAKASRLTPDAIRFYERQALLPRPRRTSGGFREYDATVLDRLRFIKQAQTHGLTLREIRDLVIDQGRPGRDQCRRVRDLVAKRLQQLEDQRRELDAFCSTLREYLTMCERALERPGQTQCPVVEDLGRETQRRRVAS